jgi:excinuclease UvrABC ATPase subunit
VKVNGVNVTYEGLIPKIKKSMLSKDHDALQPHTQAFGDRAITRQVCPERGGTRLAELARSSRIGEINIADACAMQISDAAHWLGKSVIVIEYHPAVMAHADWIIDLGPGAGHDGGRIVYEGTPADLVAARSTLTGEHIAAYVSR